MGKMSNSFKHNELDSRRTYNKPANSSTRINDKGDKANSSVDNNNEANNSSAFHGFTAQVEGKNSVKLTEQTSLQYLEKMEKTCWLLSKNYL